MGSSEPALVYSAGSIPCSPLRIQTLKTNLYFSISPSLKLTKTKYVCEQYTLQFGPCTVQYSQVIKFRTVASFCVLRNFTTDGTDDQL